MKRLIGTIIGLILVFIIITFTVAYFTLNNGSFLTSFDFKSITNTGLDFYVYFEDVKIAEKYDILAYNKENEVIYRDTIKDNSTTIKFDNLKFNNAYKNPPVFRGIFIMLLGWFYAIMPMNFRTK